MNSIGIFFKKDKHHRTEKVKHSIKKCKAIREVVFKQRLSYLFYVHSLHR